MQIAATFRDVDDAERFVWIRAFPNMEARARSLECFYGGAVWREHRVSANATMRSSDDVLLLRPAWPRGGFADLARRAPAGDRGTVVAIVVTLNHAVGDEDLAHFRGEAAPLIENAGAGALACLITEPSVNTFPALPVREGENVVACFAGLSGPRAGEVAARLRADMTRATQSWPGAAGLEMRVLAPTRTSRLTGRSPTVSASDQVFAGGPRSAGSADAR